VKKLTHEEFVQRMAKGNPKVKVVGQYHTSHTLISVECLECGNSWEARSYSLVQGHGCPKCEGNCPKSAAKKFNEFMEQHLDITLRGEYVGVDKPIDVECRKHHHQWKSTPKRLLRGHGCPKCAGLCPESAAEKFNEFMERHPDIILRSEYVNAHTTVDVECKRHHHTWKARPYDLLRGHGCRKCAGLCPEIAAKKFNAFIEQHPDIILWSTYTGANKPVTVECRKHHRRWKSTPIRLLRGDGCIVCAGKCQKTAAKKFNEFMNQRPAIILLGNYVAAKKPVAVECRECHHQWHTTPKSLLEGHGCRNCAGLCPKSAAKKFNKLMEQHPDIVLHGEYVNAHTPVAVECVKCHHLWEAAPINLNNHHGCPNCAQYGFQPDRAAITYYVRVANPYGAPLYKIGVTHRTVAKRFALEGVALVPISIWHFDKGSNAQALEIEILEKHRAHHYEGPPVFKYGGNDELFTCDVLRLDNGAQLEFSFAA
jgi:ferredoxin